jgi:sporulation protein YlmC with PRC-barrel domain
MWQIAKGDGNMQQDVTRPSLRAISDSARAGRTQSDVAANIEIPVEAQVECTDGVGGHSVYVLINPVTEQLTHLVVRASLAPHMEYLVPVELVIGTIAGNLQVRCSQAELAGMEPFIQTEYISNPVPRSYVMYNQAYSPGQYYYWPYVGSEHTAYEPVEHREIPFGELAVRRGTHVEAMDGPVGQVDEFVVNSRTGHITHLVMREGHAWAPKEVIIPVSALSDVRHDSVLLKLDKHAIEALPTFPVQRRWA